MSWGELSVSTRVVEAVAEYSGTDVLDLPPLYDSIDPDALERILPGMTEGYVSFVYADQRVTVDSYGAISVEEYTPPGEPGE